jgi:NADH dehydrogenase
MITVVGGTGRLGTELVRLLHASGTPVRVASRSGVVPADLADLVDDVVRADVRSPATLGAAVLGSDVVVSAVHGLGSRGRRISPQSVDHHGNVHLVDAAVRAGADVVLVSVAGASPAGSELERAKWAAEEHLRRSGAAWTIVRATAFEELWTEIIAGSAARDGRAVVLGRGENPVNVVPVATVARAVADACLDPGTRGGAIDVCGSRDVRFADLARAHCASGSRPRRVPRTVLRIVGQVARPVRPDLARLARMAVWMDTADLARAEQGAVPAAG